MVFLRWLNAALLLMGASLAVTMGVVCIIYLFYLETAPQLRNEWPMLLKTTLLFGVVAVVAGVSFFGLLRDTRWKWFGQAALTVTVVLIGATLWRMLTGA